MPDGYSTGDMLDFLEHAAERGMVPAATAQGLAVASRQVLSVLADGEGDDVRKLDLDSVVHRFHNKRARDFSPGSLRTYEQRTRRAIDEFLTWRADPANFRAKTRAPVRRTAVMEQGIDNAGNHSVHSEVPPPYVVSRASGYQTSFPLRPGYLITIANVPQDLTPAEAERMAQFVRMLAVETK
jgi:hypothetical protein